MFKSVILFFINSNRLYYINIFKCLDYAVFEESWENEVEIDYCNNMDRRKIFLMELHAWLEMSMKISNELLELAYLSKKGNLFYVFKF